MGIAPMERNVACFAGDAAPYVFTSASLSSCRVAVPTPPAAPVTNAVWPARTFATRWSGCIVSAVLSTVASWCRAFSPATSAVPWSFYISEKVDRSKSAGLEKFSGGGRFDVLYQGTTFGPFRRGGWALSPCAFALPSKCSRRVLLPQFRRAALPGFRTIYSRCCKSQNYEWVAQVSPLRPGGHAEGPKSLFLASRLKLVPCSRVCTDCSPATAGDRSRRRRRRCPGNVVEVEEVQQVRLYGIAAVRCALGPMKRFSTNLITAVWSMGICET